MNHGIVLGCPRSGTTYLMSVLNTIPEFECVSGTLLPVAIPHVVNQGLQEDVYDALAVGFERSIDAYLHSGRYQSRSAALQKWVRAPNGVTGLLKALRGTRPLPEMMIYKEPFLSLAPQFVLDAFPDARIVHIVRDGRDCANSLVHSYDVLTDDRLKNLRGSEMRLGRKYDERYVPWWVEKGREHEFIGSTPYVRAIWMWKVMVRRCYEVFSRDEVKKSGQVFLLRYEDFMQHPQTYARLVVRHLGGAEPSPKFQERLSRARTTSIGKHERRSDAEIEAAEHLADEELRLYGYKDNVAVSAGIHLARGER